MYVVPGSRLGISSTLKRSRTPDHKLRYAQFLGKIEHNNGWIYVAFSVQPSTCSSTFTQVCLYCSQCYPDTVFLVCGLNETPDIAGGIRTLPSSFRCMQYIRIKRHTGRRQFIVIML